ncbi:hypothetical protein RJT34_17491 [Clitoria ternatea]|uniref:Uncharacterized protein n=1 Tax=Clitoria ternatea TaxID=43366 RepID=A0AAN9PEW6_CLITE
MHEQVVLNNATVETDNSSLRDRAYICWRLLSTDPEVLLELKKYATAVDVDFVREAICVIGRYAIKLKQEYNRRLTELEAGGKPLELGVTIQLWTEIVGGRHHN